MSDKVSWLTASAFALAGGVSAIASTFIFPTISPVSDNELTPVVSEVSCEDSTDSTVGNDKCSAPTSYVPKTTQATDVSVASNGTNYLLGHEHFDPKNPVPWLEPSKVIPGEKDTMYIYDNESKYTCPSDALTSAECVDVLNEE